jgi:hypothetical protein
MLEAIDVLTGARETLRRVVRIPCDLVSATFDEPVELEITDLSPDGAFLATSLPLEDGEELDLAFEVPRLRRLLAVKARVRRAALYRRKQDEKGSGMGIEFLDLSDAARDALGVALYGIPPRLPVSRVKTPARHMRSRPRRSAKQMVWVDSLHDWGEGDLSNELETAIDGATAITALHLG